MSPTTRSWVAFASVGAGLIHLALVISAPLVGGILLATIGIVEFAWGILVMFDARFLVPRVAVFVALAPVALWLAALALGVQSFLPAPLAIATLFELFIAVTSALVLRRDRVAGALSTARFVVGVLAAALVIGALTALALAMSAPVTGILFDDGVHH